MQVNIVKNESGTKIVTMPAPLNKEVSFFASQLYDFFISLGLYVVPQRWQWLAPLYMVKRSRVRLLATHDEQSNNIVFVMTGLLSEEQWQMIADKDYEISAMLQRHVTIKEGRIILSPLSYNGQFTAIP